MSGLVQLCHFTDQVLSRKEALLLDQIRVLAIQAQGGSGDLRSLGQQDGPSPFGSHGLLEQCLGHGQIRYSMEIQSCSCFLFHMVPESCQQGFKFQAAHVFICFFCVEVSDPGVLRREFHRSIDADLCQLIRKLSQISVLLQGFFCPGRLYL